MEAIPSMRAAISRTMSLAVVLGIGLLAVAALILSTGNEISNTSTTVSPITTSSTGGSSTIETASNATSGVNPCGVGVQVIALNKTEYCSDDVTNDIILGGPGYSHFLNGSVTFMGVTFQTYCPSSSSGCPGANSSATTVLLGMLRFTMTFPDKTNETASAVISGSTYLPIVSNHTEPKAGMLVETQYGAQGTAYHVFLLVERP